jgi:hypothetical protein
VPVAPDDAVAATAPFRDTPGGAVMRPAPPGWQTKRPGGPEEPAKKHASLPADAAARVPRATVPAGALQRDSHAYASVSSLAP